MSLCADVYALLAELFACPPDWMDLAGKDWPLFEMLTQLAPESNAARRHLDRLAGIPPETRDQRLGRYEELFASGSPRFWLYESAALTGKILGPQTFEVAKLYRTAGLEIEGAELPDSISVELAFLSHLARQLYNVSYEKQFIEQHTGWMIDLGRALARSGDQVYAPIGAFLADWLTEQLHPAPRTSQHTPRIKQLVTRNTSLPFIARVEDCTLCGFCVQVCPTHALRIHEDAENTLLQLSPADCIGCGKCERVCDFHSMKMQPANVEVERTVLRQSPRVRCQKCGEPIVSKAEMDFVAAQVGSPAWLHLCLKCRAERYI